MQCWRIAAGLRNSSHYNRATCRQCGWSRDDLHETFLSVGEPRQSVAEELRHESRRHRSRSTAATDTALADPRHGLVHRLRRIFALQTETALSTSA